LLGAGTIIAVLFPLVVVKSAHLVFPPIRGGKIVDFAFPCEFDAWFFPCSDGGSVTNSFPGKSSDALVSLIVVRGVVCFWGDGVAVRGHLCATLPFGPFPGEEDAGGYFLLSSYFRV